jgi:hypothetical protein
MKTTQTYTIIGSYSRRDYPWLVPTYDIETGPLKPDTIARDLRNSTFLDVDVLNNQIYTVVEETS